MTYKVALIGLGNVGYKYDMYQNEASCLTHYSSIMNLKGFELTLAIDNDEKNRNEFEKYSKIKPISNDELSFVNQEIDVIVIATPPESHIEIINKVAKLKPRLIFCEKPLAISNREILSKIVEDSTIIYSFEGLGYTKMLLLIY